MEYKVSSRYIPIIYLLYSWGSRFGVPSRVPVNYLAILRLHVEAQALFLWTKPFPSVLCGKRLKEDPKIIPIIPYSHYYWVGGPPKL